MNKPLVIHKWSITNLEFITSISMAAISIVSGTSLNAFFHPCENLQSIAIQCDWHGANSELLSCIIKTKLYYQRAEKVGPGQVPLLSLERAKMRCERATGKEAHSCSGWQDGLVLLWKDFHSRPPAGTLSAGAAGDQEDLQGFGTAACFTKNLLLSQLHYVWIPSTAS